MAERSEGPLIVQSDRTILLETAHPRYEEARDSIARFAELEKSPEHIHTYRLSPLSLWNAAASGLGAAQIVAALDELSKYPVPQNVRFDVEDIVGRYGKLRLMRGEAGELFLKADEDYLLDEIARLPAVAPCIEARLDARSLAVKPGVRGALKQSLIKAGFPVEDLAGYVDGAPLAIALRAASRGGRPFTLRHYQEEAVRLFYAEGSNRRRFRRHRAALRRRQDDRRPRRRWRSSATQTLILTANVSALRQWRDEILDKTDLSRRAGRRVQRPREGDPSGHALDVPAPHLSPRQERGVPALQAVRRARLGAHRLRRGASAAGRRCSAPPPSFKPAGVSASRRRWCARTAGKTTSLR